LNGTGLPGILSAPKTFAISGKVGVLTTGKLNIKNGGKGVLTIIWPDVLVPPYNITHGSFTLQPGKSQPIQVGFTPASKGKALPTSLLLTVTSVGGGAATVPIQGTGK